MRFQRELRGGVACVLALALACPPAEALVTLNDGHDHLYVTGGATYAWDSNLFANNAAQSDSSVNTTLLAEYTRRAGWIGVNGSLELDSNRYRTFTSEDFNNPKASVELTKQSGRTTGSLTLQAARESRADAAVNTRTTSWNYDAGLNFRYPIVQIYTLSGQLGYSLIKYIDSVYPDLATYSASTDLIRMFSSERDVMIGYRYRRSETSGNSSYDDHAATIGMAGKLIRGINGTLNFGYQVRVPHGFESGGQPEKSFGSWTASGSGTYAINKKANLTGTIAKDFATTATDTSVDTVTGSLTLQYAYSSHWMLAATGSMGDSRFAGESGRVVIHGVLGPQRHDDFVSGSVSLNYTLNEHLKISGSYNWFKNWSTLSYADFVRASFDFDVSSRW